MSLKQIIFMVLTSDVLYCCASPTGHRLEGHYFRLRVLVYVVEHVAKTRSSETQRCAS